MAYRLISSSLILAFATPSHSQQSSIVQNIQISTTTSIGYGADAGSIDRDKLSAIFDTPDPTTEDRRKVVLNYEAPTVQVDSRSKNCEDYSEEGFFCVSAGLCSNGFIVVDTTNAINPRIGGTEVNIEKEIGNSKCPGYDQVCCRAPGFTNPVTVPQYKPRCGIRNANGIGVSLSVVNDPFASGRTQFGEFPYTCLIAKDNRAARRLDYVCTATLVHPQVIITAAHCLRKIDQNDLRIRCGEWDARSVGEALPAVDRTVSKIFIHPEYDEKTVVHDIAVVQVDRPYTLVENIDLACLPKEGSSRNRRCLATGWGKDNFNGNYNTILRKVSLYVADRSKCQRQLNRAIGFPDLGPANTLFKLDDSFLCGNGTEDTCTGDGGGPMVCQRRDDPDTYDFRGIVSWGVGCGSGVPGVYIDVEKQLCFIKYVSECMQITRSSQFSEISCNSGRWTLSRTVTLENELSELKERLSDSAPGTPSFDQLQTKISKVERTLESWGNLLATCSSGDVDVSGFVRNIDTE